VAEAPIFWTTTEPNYNDRDRHKRYMKDGKRVVEKIPQSGHVGGYTDRKRAQGVRFVTMVNSVGNSVSVVLTNGAGHMDPNTAYGQHVKRKARSLSWFGIGECPCALIATGEINPDGFLSESVRKGEPCRPGTFSGKDLDNMCPHAVAERNARQAEQTRSEAERADKMKGKEDKILELLTQQALGSAEREQRIADLLAASPEVKRKREEK